MNSQNQPLTGLSALQKLLSESCRDLRDLEMTEFRQWLQDQLIHWQRDPAFRLKIQIRDLRHTSSPLRRLEKETREVHAAYSQSPLSETITRVERELEDTGKAIQGLEQACAAADDNRRHKLEAKLRTFHSRQGQLRQQLQDLTQASPLRQQLLNLTEELEQLRHALGLDRLERELADLLRQKGQRSGRAGTNFELQALDSLWERIVPSLAPDFAPKTVRILTGVTLDAARVELDQLLIAQPEQPDDPALVLAVIETKRNINDLAHGFRLRQENLAWLTGYEQGYDPELYRNRHFPTGHFDRNYFWKQEKETLMFNQSSFRLFRPDSNSGFFLDRLCFVTRPGRIWGASSGALSRLQHRVATDHRFEIQSDASIERLQAWFRGITSSLETPDVLSLYAQDEKWAQQILLLEPH